MPFRLFYKRNEKVKLLIRLGPHTKKRNKRERSVILGAFCLFRLVGSWFHEGNLSSDGAFSCGIERKVIWNSPSASIVRVSELIIGKFGEEFSKKDGLSWMAALCAWGGGSGKKRGRPSWAALLVGEMVVGLEVEVERHLDLAGAADGVGGDAEAGGAVVEAGVGL